MDKEPPRIRRSEFSFKKYIETLTVAYALYSLSRGHILTNYIRIFQTP